MISGVNRKFESVTHSRCVRVCACAFSSQVEKANRLAAEIEGQSSDNVHVREERGQHVDDSGMDEEDRFSGVVRDKVASGAFWWLHGVLTHMFQTNVDADAWTSVCPLWRRCW